jgi:hypothetical protein
MTLNLRLVALLIGLNLCLGAPSFAKHHHKNNNPPAQNNSGQNQSVTVAQGPAGEPACLDNNGKQLNAENAQVLNLKTTTQNQFLARAHVTGVVGNIYPDHAGHNHFQAIIGPKPGDTIEIIYNISFGALPHLVPGMTVDTCGDFINSDAATSLYPASPDGAIMHWIHRNPHGSHKSGFLIINGTVYGEGAGDGGA